MRFRALLFSFLFAAAAIAASAQGLPDLGDASSASLSETQERTIGNRIMRDVRIDPAYVDDPEVSDYLNSLGQRLLLAAEGPRREISFFVVQDDTINAFALVGGHIGVHTGLIALTQNESELAGVVAHEIAHILQRHQARMMHGSRGTQWTSLAALALAMLASRGGGSQSGQITEAAIAGAGALQIQNQLNYTREHEREADRVGLTLLDRAGFDPRGMASFFDRMLRANRLNEYKGAPSYLRTHPLTTERIADIQDRVNELPARMVPDSLDYRIARAKIRASTGSAAEAVELFKTLLEDKTVVRPREDVYGMALAQRRARDLQGAWKTLEPLRQGASHPAFELLAAQLAADMGRNDQSVEIYRKAVRANASYRALLYGYLNQLTAMGRDKEVLAELDDRLRLVQDDPRLYEIQARAYEHTGQPIAQHRAQAEAYYRKGNLSAAVDQLELAVKQKGSNFYEISSAESRLRELRAQLEIQRAAEKALNIS
ncbi:MAG TPA: M48 family metalloprotease [Usitatibacter sp.]|nr:M48 family metalloprotease [Usitatibacter sp.]